jgi:hypothetical protein
VKYLHENGENIRANNDEAVLRAAQNGHLNVIKYFTEQKLSFRCREIPS